MELWILLAVGVVGIVVGIVATAIIDKINDKKQ